MFWRANHWKNICVWDLGGLFFGGRGGGAYHEFYCSRHIGGAGEKNKKGEREGEREALSNSHPSIATLFVRPYPERGVWNRRAAKRKAQKAEFERA